MDRFDLRLEVPAVAISDLSLPPEGATSAEVAERVARARAVQAERYADRDGVTVNADIGGDALMEVAGPDADGAAILTRAVERFRMSARGYHRVLKVARTIADLDGSDAVRRPHVAEALSFRLVASTAI
jgi:magnesium chelatase family protein